MKMNDITFVVQGAVSDITNDVIKSIKKYFIGAEIIVSCWKSCDIDGLGEDITVIQNIDPECDFIYNEKEELVFKENTSRQIVTTLNGLLEVRTSYAVKIRSDMIFNSSNFITQYEKFMNMSNSNIFESPILISSINTVNPFAAVGYVHHYSDWFFFGKTVDLLKLWEFSRNNINNISGKINIKRDWEYQSFPFTEYTAEQRIFVNLIKKYYGEYNYCESKHKFLMMYFISNELILLSPNQIGFAIDKYKYLIDFNYSNFQDMKRYIAFYLSTLSFGDWLFFRNLSNNKVSVVLGMIFLIKTLLSNFLIKKSKK